MPAGEPDGLLDVPIGQHRRQDRHDCGGDEHPGRLRPQGCGEDDDGPVPQIERVRRVADGDDRTPAQRAAHRVGRIAAGEDEHESPEGGQQRPRPGERRTPVDQPQRGEDRCESHDGDHHRERCRLNAHRGECEERADRELPCAGEGRVEAEPWGCGSEERQREGADRDRGDDDDGGELASAPASEDPAEGEQRGEDQVELLLHRERPGVEQGLISAAASK